MQIESKLPGGYLLLCFKFTCIEEFRQMFKSSFSLDIIKFKLASCLILFMANETQVKIEKSELSTGELISHFREKCSICAHHRIMHDDLGKCEGVMNKPCTSGCDKFNAE